MAGRAISLRGVAVHNLKEIDLDVPRRRLVVLCGLSGSGKTSLALDTLYAEGQRRYIDSFSAYTRQFLERLEKPAAERIDGIPPAIAVTHKNTSRSSRSTVGTATETSDHLRLLFAKIGQVFCTGCGQEVRRHTSQSVAERLAGLPVGTRYLVTFAVEPAEAERDALWPAFQAEGFVRAIVGDRLVDLAAEPWSQGQPPADAKIFAVVDRLAAGTTSPQRLRDSLETAFAKGRGTVYVFLAPPSPAEVNGASADATCASLPAGSDYPLDGATWRQLAFTDGLVCQQCGISYPDPEPRLFSFNSPLGACPACEGFGNIVDIDMDLVVPDANKSIKEGAIAPWNTPAYEHELQELIELASDYGLRVDVPYRELDEAERLLILEGVRERNFGGLRGFSPGWSGENTRCTCGCS